MQHGPYKQKVYTHNGQSNFDALKAMGAKVGDALSTLGASVTKVDNASDPTSAYSMMRRKDASRGVPDNFVSDGKVIPYRNDKQKNGY